MITLLLAVALDCSKFAGYQPPAAPVDVNDRTLAERYANGDGVKRNLDAAAFFLCRAGEEMAPAEFEGMSQHLQRMREGKEKDPLDFCEYVTSGYGMSYCANQQYDKLMPQLDRQLAAYPAAVRERGVAYARAEAERIGEQSRGGTAYAAISLGAELEQKERLVLALERFSKKRAPSASAADAKRADDELNAVYRAKQKEIDEADDEEIARWKTFLRDAQRAWIAYRDAFAAYYAERWRGKASPEELRREIVTHLTRARTADLRD